MATMWDEATAPVVATYVMLTAKTLAGEAKGWEAAEARMLADRLGLSPVGLQALNWRVARPGEDADVVEPRSVEVAS